MSVFKNGLFLSLAKFSEKIISFLIVVIASRYYGAEGIGEFFYYFSLVSLFIPLMDLGFEKLMMHEWYDTSKSEKEKLLGRLFLTKCIVGGPALILVLFTDYLVRWGDANPKAVLASFLAIYMMEFAELVRRPAFADGSIYLDVIAPLLARVITLILLFKYVDDIHHGYQIAYLYAAANIIAFLISLLGLNRYRSINIKGTRIAHIRDFLIKGFPFSLTSLFVMISLFIDSVILGHYSFEEVGEYSAAYRVILVVAALSGGTSQALFPMVVEKFSNKQENKAMKLLSSVFRVHIIFFGTLSIGGFILGNEIMTGLYGNAFRSAGLPFQILALLIVLFSMTNLLGQTLEAMKLQKKVMKVTCIAAIFNLVTNLILIPFWGMIGAALTTIITEILILVLQLKIIKSLPYTFTLTQQLKRAYIFITLAGLCFLPLPLLNGFLSQYLLNNLLSLIISIGFGGLIVSSLLIKFKHYWLEGLIQGNSNAYIDGK
ncbi:MAG: flippase [Lentisphaeria bacterium]|nr:flippase [Lentisphaeria bacterium]